MKRKLLAAVVLGLLAAGCRRGLPMLGQAPPFGQNDLAGRPWIVDFVYTTCPGPCPALSANMARLQRSLPPPVRLVSVTVDPEHDTPGALAEYAKRFGADPARWRFVRLSEAELARVMGQDGFKLALAAKGTIVHSTKLVLVDAQGAIRGYYDGEDEAALKRLEGDAADLAR